MEQHQPIRLEPAIHLAAPDSIHRVVPLFDEYRQWYGMPSDLSGAQSFLVERTINAESTIFFAELENTVVAFAQLYPLFSSISMASVWVLNDLYVCESYRSQGLGSILLETAIEFARGVGAIRLELETAETNHAAQNFYKRHGWIQETDLQRYTLNLADQHAR